MKDLSPSLVCTSFWSPDVLRIVLRTCQVPTRTGVDLRGTVLCDAGRTKIPIICNTINNDNDNDNDNGNCNVNDNDNSNDNDNNKDNDNNDAFILIT